MKKYFTAILFSIFILPVFAQMPDWKYFCDIEGNTYYFDEAGHPKVILSEENLIIVSLSAIEYYMAKAEEYFRQSNYVNALIIIKSVLAMPDTDSRIIDNKKACIRLLDKIKKKTGTRISQEKKKVFFFGYKIKNDTVIFVNPMRLKITLNDCEVKLIRKRQFETDYKYCGFSFILQKNGVKILLSADSEEYVMQRRLRLSNFKNSLYANLPAWPMKRLSSSEDEFEVSEFTVSGSKFALTETKNYAGYEKIGVNKNIGYCVRFICEEKDFNTVKADMLKWVEAVKAIN